MPSGPVCQHRLSSCIKSRSRSLPLENWRVVWISRLYVVNRLQSLDHIEESAPKFVDIFPSGGWARCIYVLFQCVTIGIFQKNIVRSILYKAPVEAYDTLAEGAPGTQGLECFHFAEIVLPCISRPVCFENVSIRISVARILYMLSQLTRGI